MSPSGGNVSAVHALRIENLSLQVRLGCGVLEAELGRSLRLNPVVIFLWVLVWAWMWGIGGLLLAVPLLVAVRICAERLPRLRALATVLSRG